MHRQLHQIADVLSKEPEAFHLHLEAQLIALGIMIPLGESGKEGETLDGCDVVVLKFTIHLKNWIYRTIRIRRFISNIITPIVILCYLVIFHGFLFAVRQSPHPQWTGCGEALISQRCRLAKVRLKR